MVKIETDEAKNTHVGPEAFAAFNRGVPNVYLFGMLFSNITKAELFTEISSQIESRKPGYINTPNVDHLCAYHRNPDFAAAYHGSFLNVADGMPIVFASRLLGRPIKEKISGSDLIFDLSAYAAERGHSVYFLGAAPGVAEAASEKLLERHEKLKIAGVYSPPLGFEKDPEEIANIHRRLQDASPDICFVALGSPKQELWISQHYEATGVPVHIGIGASFDFVAGRVRRAPEWMQRTGLEWFWRLCQEPRRLARRYLYDDLLFFKLLYKEWRGLRASATDPKGSTSH